MERLGDGRCWSLFLVRLEVLGSDFSGAGAIRKAQALQDRGDVNFHHPKADIELSGNFLVRHALYEDFENSELYGIEPAYETELQSAALSLVQISNLTCGSDAGR